MPQAIYHTNFCFKGQTDFYRGKVRDVYIFKDRMACVTTDRISAFDIVLPKGVPYKGQILNQITAKFLKATQHIAPSWLRQAPHPNVMVGIKCHPFSVEMVIRGYLTGHVWRVYKSGCRTLCGVTLPSGMHENDPFPKPVITPATKNTKGHDEDISAQAIIDDGLLSAQDYAQLEAYTYALFEYGTKLASDQGLILVDTKYEFGRLNDTIYLIDEVHTPDSSRYFYQQGYAKRQAKGAPQKHLSKEFVRQWLIEHGFQGLKGQAIPAIPDAFIHAITQRYVELYEQITGNPFIKNETTNIMQALEHSINTALS